MADIKFAVGAPYRGGAAVQRALLENRKAELTKATRTADAARKAHSKAKKRLLLMEQGYDKNSEAQEEIELTEDHEAATQFFADNGNNVGLLREHFPQCALYWYGAPPTEEAIAEAKVSVDSTSAEFKDAEAAKDAASLAVKEAEAELAKLGHDYNDAAAVTPRFTQARRTMPPTNFNGFNLLQDVVFVGDVPMTMGVLAALVYVEEPAELPEALLLRPVRSPSERRALARLLVTTALVCKDFFNLLRPVLQRLLLLEWELKGPPGRFMTLELLSGDLAYKVPDGEQLNETGPYDECWLRCEELELYKLPRGFHLGYDVTTSRGEPGTDDIVKHPFHNDNFVDLLFELSRYEDSPLFAFRHDLHRALEQKWVGWDVPLERETKSLWPLQVRLDPPNMTPSTALLPMDINTKRNGPQHRDPLAIGHKIKFEVKFEAEDGHFKISGVIEAGEGAFGMNSSRPELASYNDLIKSIKNRVPYSKVRHVVRYTEWRFVRFDSTCVEEEGEEVCQQGGETRKELEDRMNVWTRNLNMPSFMRKQFMEER